MEKYRDSVFPVPPYRPVANPPAEFDADGSVLRGMAASIEQVGFEASGRTGTG